MNTHKPLSILISLLLGGCCTTTPCITPIQVTLTPAVGTLVREGGKIDDSTHACNPASPPPPDIQTWWNNLPPSSQVFPHVGFELWRNTTGNCEQSRLDAYRALATFDLNSVSHLKGLVGKAELILVPQPPLPGAVGSHLGCQAFSGGAGALEHIPSTAAGNLPPVNKQGALTEMPKIQSGNGLEPAPFPSGNVEFNFPRPWAAGSVPGARTPTITSASVGGNTATFVVDVTDRINGALNTGRPTITWMLTSTVETGLNFPVISSLNGRDCKTPYEFKLQITHL